MRTRKPRGNRATYCTAGSNNRKIRYKTLKDAKAARTSLMVNDRADYIRIYKCPTCGGYHLTKKRPILNNSTVWKDTASDRMPYNDTENQSYDEENTHD